jgi:hypothetical protein
MLSFTHFHENCHLLFVILVLMAVAELVDKGTHKAY